MLSKIHGTTIKKCDNIEVGRTTEGSNTLGKTGYERVTAATINALSIGRFLIVWAAYEPTIPSHCIPCLRNYTEQREKSRVESLP